MHLICSVMGACSTPISWISWSILFWSWGFLPLRNIQGQELASLPLLVPRAAPWLYRLKN